MKKKQAAKVYYNPKMSGLWTLNCSKTLKTTWIDMKILLNPLRTMVNYGGEQDVFSPKLNMEKHTKSWCIPKICLYRWNWHECLGLHSKFCSNWRFLYWRISIYFQHVFCYFFQPLNHMWVHIVLILVPIHSDSNSPNPSHSVYIHIHSKSLTTNEKVSILTKKCSTSLEWVK